jgi:DNA (cytosine-5)-methyltransferase 1
MPTILDLFSCAGGAARGYDQAGLTVTCLDNQPQPNNPYPFIQADALHYLRDTSDTYDLYHASPPCQGYTALQNVNQNWDNWPRYITELRTLLDATGKPYIIENVIGSRDQLRNPITLCGEMFGLGVMRHRLFETNWGLTQPKHVPHRGRVRGWRHGVYYDGP